MKRHFLHLQGNATTEKEKPTAKNWSAYKPTEEGKGKREMIKE